jgi:hypothetical protein
MKQADAAVCDGCPCRTPFMADPEKLARARELDFEPPLDEGIREIVLTLIVQGVQTCESCEGGTDRAF